MGPTGLDESTSTILPEEDHPARSRAISRVGLETKSSGRSTSSAEETVGKRACGDPPGILEKQNHLMINARIQKKLDSSATSFCFSRILQARPLHPIGAPRNVRLRSLHLAGLRGGLATEWL